MSLKKGTFLMAGGQMAGYGECLAPYWKRVYVPATDISFVFDGIYKIPVKVTEE